jgi:hypothetical protein
MITKGPHCLLRRSLTAFFLRVARGNRLVTISGRSACHMSSIRCSKCFMPKGVIIILIIIVWLASIDLRARVYPTLWNHIDHHGYLTSTRCEVFHRIGLERDCWLRLPMLSYLSLPCFVLDFLRWTDAAAQARFLTTVDFTKS